MTKRFLHGGALCRPLSALRAASVGFLRNLLFGSLVATLVTVSQAAVVINEFMAENDGFLRDLDGDTPDWIELRNTGASATNLAGWHLTDSPTNLTKWTFPSTNISAGGFLIVFASGKDRTNAAELHTSFQLQNDGGYLALIQPDGVTIASEFNYPQQHRNVSFGPNSPIGATFPFLNVGAGTRWSVPAITEPPTLI